MGFGGALTAMLLVVVAGMQYLKESVFISR